MISMAPNPALFFKFSDKFKEVKDAARLAREKSQDKELANSALTIAAPQVRLWKWSRLRPAWSS